MKLGLIAFVLAVFGSTAGRAAQAPCDRDLISVGGPQGYQLRQSEGVCDGLFVSRVGAPAMEIVSVTRSDGLHGSAPDHLDLSVAAPEGLSPVHLRAIGIPFGFYYRLDATVAPGQVVRWSARRVLGAVNVPLDQVGVFAYAADATGTPVYLPVTIGTLPAVSGSASTIVALRAAGIPEDLQYRFIHSQDGREADGGWHNVKISQNRITVTLPAASGTLKIRWSDSEIGEARQATFAIGAPPA